MTTHVALLRGINLGARNKVPKQTLLDVFGAAGATDVRTYIQSGNVLFRAEDHAADGIALAVSAAIAGQLGLTVPVVLRTVAELRAVVERNPFAAGHPTDKLHAMFLSGTPAPEIVVGLDPWFAAPETFAVVDREIYLHLPNGAARSRLSNDWFDRRLKLISTSRNWRTVTTLLGMCEG